MHLSEHFTLGEFTESNHKEVYNIPNPEALENLTTAERTSELSSVAI